MQEKLSTKIRSKDTIMNSQTSLRTSTYGAQLHAMTQDTVEAREGAKVQRQTMPILWEARTLCERLQEQETSQSSQSKAKSDTQTDRCSQRRTSKTSNYKNYPCP